jgi:hypothetical protein
MVLLAYRHGLRAAEVVDLRWEQAGVRCASYAAAGECAIAVRVCLRTRRAAIGGRLLPND